MKVSVPSIYGLHTVQWSYFAQFFELQRVNEVTTIKTYLLEGYNEGYN